MTDLPDNAVSAKRTWRSATLAGEAIGYPSAQGYKESRLVIKQEQYTARL